MNKELFNRYFKGTLIIGLIFTIIAMIVYISYDEGVSRLEKAQLKVYSYRLLSRGYFQAISANNATLKHLSDYKRTEAFEDLEGAYIRLMSGKGLFSVLLREARRTNSGQIVRDLNESESLLIDYNLLADSFLEILDGLEEKTLSKKEAAFELKKLEDKIAHITSVLAFQESEYWESRAVDFDALRKQNQVTKRTFIILCAVLIMLLIYISFALWRRTQLEVRLERNRLQMISSSRMASLGEFAASVAHEINNPLTIILWRLKSLKRMIQKVGDEEIDKAIKSIDEQAHRVDSIIKGVKTLSRNTEHQEDKLYSVYETLEELHEIVLNKSLTNDFDFELIHDRPKAFLYGKPVQLIQVLTNLINNSIDAISEIEKKWVRVEWLLESRKIKIFVTDSGEGIPENVRKRLFELFYTTKETKGTGIGLSLSSQIIKSYGGSISYNPNGQNTQFIVTLPLAKLDNSKREGELKS